MHFDENLIKGAINWKLTHTPRRPDQFRRLRMGWACALKEFILGVEQAVEGEQEGVRGGTLQGSVCCCGAMACSCAQRLERNLQRAVSVTPSTPPTGPAPPNALLHEWEWKNLW